MKKILGTGLSGMVGSCITDTLNNRYQFIDLSYTTGVDIRNRELLHTFIKEVGTDIVLHLAAKADVESCERDAESDAKLLPTEGFDVRTASNLDWRKWEQVNSAFAINVVGTLNLAMVCKELKKKLILISTDFVFDGKKEGRYTEEDTPHPINHYARTKYWSEQVVSTIMDDYLIVRLAFPYGTHHEEKKDFVQIIRDRLESNQKVKGVNDQIITPTYAPDIAYALDNLITHSVSNTVFHAVGSESLSPYQAAVAIAMQFGYDPQMVQNISAEKFYANRTVRPGKLAISNEKIIRRGVHFSSFIDGLKKIK
jgi:dTDP-4-dehydrorhamnose reductase